MPKYTHLLFDLDNTLLDFSASQTFSLEKVFADFGTTFIEKYHPIYNEINHACWEAFEQGKMTQDVLRTERMKRLLERLQLPHNPVKFSQQYQFNLSQTKFWVEGAKELIDQLKGHYELVLITNGLKEVQRPRLQRTGLIEYFSTIVISDEINVPKPQSAFFEHTFEQINHPPKEKVLVIGDTLGSDILGGNNYGVETCWFNPKNKVINPAITPTYTIQNISALTDLLS